MTVQLTLSPSATQILELKARQMGYDLSHYAKITLEKIAKILALENDKNIPVYKMNAKTERIVLKGLKDYEAGKCTIVTNLDEL